MSSNNNNNNNNINDDEPPAKRSKGGPPPERSWGWTMSPNDTPPLSDFTIEVTVDSDSNVHSSYYVHKSVLVAKSDFFYRLFMSPEEIRDLDDTQIRISFSESVQNQCSMELPKEAADNFGKFLDCCYVYHGYGTIPTQSLVALVHFADYFGIDGLKSEALGKLKEDLLDAYDIGRVVSHFQRIRDLNSPLCLPVMAEFFRQKSSSFFGWSPSHTDLSPFVDLELWRLIASETPAKEVSEILSKSFAVFCSENEDAVNTESFKLITRPLAMPYISDEVAIKMMELEQKHNPIGARIKLTDLQERCIKAIKSEDIRHFDDIQKKVIKSLPIAVKDELFDYAVPNRPQPTSSSLSSSPSSLPYTATDRQNHIIRIDRLRRENGRLERDFDILDRENEILARQLEQVERERQYRARRARPRGFY